MTLAIIKRLITAALLGWIAFHAAHAQARGYRHHSHFRTHKVGLIERTTPSAPIAALLPNPSQPKIAIPMGLALAWLGYALWAERRAEPGLERDLVIAEDSREPAFGNVR